jgi:glycosyltransferase involved in cell wall biosynthesis
LAVPFMLPTWRHLPARQPYDWILASSHTFAHQAAFGGLAGDPPKYVYVHTPARYIWDPETDSRGQNPLIKVAAGLIKPVDRRRAQEATKLAANSELTRRRIRQAWHRDADVIHPPVRVSEIQAALASAAGLTEAERRVLDALPKTFILGASRFIAYKRLDLVIDLAQWAGVSAVIAGQGPLEAKLRAKAQAAHVPVHFVKEPSDRLLWELYRRATALVFPAVEDFGIVPVEAMAAGTPVIVNHHGGAKESVVDGATGHVVDVASREELVAALDRASRLDPEPIAAHAKSFDNAVFRQKMAHWLGFGPTGES